MFRLKYIKQYNKKKLDVINGFYGFALCIFNTTVCFSKAPACIRAIKDSLTPPI